MGGKTGRGGVHAAGVFYAAGGASLWGVSFIAPLMMPGVSAWDVSLGRYMVFGCLAALLMWRGGGPSRGLTASQWGTAFLFAFMGYYGCYTVLVAAIGIAGVALPTLVMGLTPVSVALAANLKTRETPFRRMAAPLCAIGLGLAAVNLARHGHGLSRADLGWGMAASLTALAMLTYYLVANIVFLKNNQDISPVRWANAVGCASLAFSVAGLAARLALVRATPWEGTATSPGAYVCGSLVLGLLVSWLGGVLWNRATTLLPAGVSGQAIVFWPLSGILYACILQGAPPSPMEAAGMALVFGGVVWGLKAAGRGSGASS